MDFSSKAYVSFNGFFKLAICRSRYSLIFPFLSPNERGENSVKNSWDIEQ